MKKSWKTGLILAGLTLIPLLFLLQPNSSARGKSPARVLQETLTPADQLAQDIALSDARVIEYTVGRRAEVFTIHPVGIHQPAGFSGCALADCRQVNLYNFDDNAAIAAIVNLDQRVVVEVLRQPGVHPGMNARLFEVAVHVLHTSPELADLLGYAPPVETLYPMPSSLAGTACGLEHPCAGVVFIDDARFENRILWAHVDLTSESFAGIGWAPSPREHGAAVPFVPEGCPPSGSLNQNGWALDYEVSGSDGLYAKDVTFRGTPVLASVKLAEWHVDYGASGFVDSIGCVGTGGFPIYPFGSPYTQPITITTQGITVNGFELVQDFRMGNWGATCNYRYEQHYQFFDDGRFRIVGAAFGRGCGTNALYRPLIRMDIAVSGDAGDHFAAWQGGKWIDQGVEAWWLQGAPYSPEGYAWRITDDSGAGYTIEPGQGQFGDGGRGDNAFIYVVQHHPGEGDFDLGAVGTCCNDDFHQGPDEYINEESINGENLVIWYVPQMLTDVTPGAQYCWTVTGGANPETYPCFAGPLFHPIPWGVFLPMLFQFP
jgi:hypothetical protein